MATTPAETTADFNDLTEVIDSLESPTHHERDHAEADHHGRDGADHDDDDSEPTGDEEANADVLEASYDDHEHGDEDVPEDGENMASGSVDFGEEHSEHPDDLTDDHGEVHVEECEAEPSHDEAMDDPVHLVEEPVKTPVSEVHVHPPVAPTSVPKAATKVVAKTSPSRLRKPMAKSPVEKPASKLVKAAPKEKLTAKPAKAAQPRLSLQARQSIGSKTTEEVKPRSMLLRLPRAAYDALFSQCPLASLKQMAGVNVEMYNAVHSQHRYWIKEGADVPAYVPTLLVSADAKTAAKWTEVKAHLHALDIAQTVKLEDLRVLRNYRTAPPGVLLLSKAIVQLMRFAPPRAGMDEKAANGDWSAIKTAFLDLKLVVRTLRIAADRVANRHPLPFTAKQLDDLVALSQSPEMDEAKFKRTCSGLLPTLDATRRILACLNVLAREIELTSFAKHQLQHAEAEDVAKVAVEVIVAKLEAAPQPAPEKSPSPSPTATELKAKARAKPVSTIPRVAVKAKTPPSVDTSVKPAVVKSLTPKTAPVRAAVKRPSTGPSGIAAPKGRASDDASSTSSSNGGSQVKRASDAKPLVKPASRVTKPITKPTTTAVSRIKAAPVAAPTLKRTLSASGDSMATLRADLVASSEELLKSTTDLKEKMAQVAALEASLESVQAALADAQNDVTALNAELEQKSKDLEARQATVLEMQCIQETLSFRVTEMTQRDSEQATTIAQLETEKKYLQAQLQDALARVEAAEADVEEKHALVEEKEHEHQKWEQAVRDQLTHEAQMEKYDLQKELAELQAAMTSLRGEHELELAGKQARIDQAEAEKKTFADELASSERRASMIHEERQQLTASLQAAQAEALRLQATIAEQEAELVKEKKRAAAADSAYNESLKMRSEDVATLD
ncbi:hypothetical protein SPRG_10624 [Saprolegnia parasitica CBS 223.65]|uniref:Uncharacterized protein n=1 Tax=Saprolegnia parasitica (strain CBS 223.65) TaxID=695850 RepID=A0A067C514_SAPPC|nr:hypothetical protein SPRG_10624 [Saprolegnia parasitica CBS 223.65]KDO24195.1 hypothetical protein SPRG_10624 [Saprolegnia parasitica CBS 223.65]|eukprot:XP_012205139.1 hypothetical protein SPRG_10624 [Saprolegnia parasitica CBS 223.65]